MLKNHIKIAFRNLARNKVYSIINLAGLAIGMACCFLIALWILDECSYDQFHEKKDRIFRVNTISEDYGTMTTSSWRLGPALKDRYPEISEYSRVWSFHSSPVIYEDKRFIENSFYLADPSFFTLYSFPFVYGRPETSLAELNDIVLTEETARRYFGDKNPIGKTLYVSSFQSDFIVTGVIENVPEQSHLNFDMIARIEWMGEQRLSSWEFTGATYVLLSPGASNEDVDQKIQNFYRETPETNPENNLVLQPLTKIRLYERGEPGIIRQVYIFSAIALFILFIAAINFMNLATARSARRAKEVGMRKIIGAGRGRIVLFFLGESMLLSFFALILAVAITELALPVFNNFTGKSLQLSAGINIKVFMGVVGVALTTGLLAGVYPAFFLSSVSPAQIVRGQLNTGKRGAIFRRLLVIFQFAVSIGLIICTIVLFKQLQFIHEKDIGLNRDHVLTIPLPNDPSLAYQYEPVKEALTNMAGVINVTAAASRPTQVGEFISINWEGHLEEDSLPIGYTMVDYQFFETFELDIVQGRSLSEDFVLDETEGCIINETALAAMELESPIGIEIDFQHPALDTSFRSVTIVGVVEDFHFRSMHEPIGPFIFRVYKPWLSYLFVRIRPENMQDTIGAVEALWARVTGGYPFEYEFLDEAYSRLYRSERQQEQLFNVFGLLAILISCMGLLGLAAYMTEQKTKEIGIRKVLGATVSNVTLFLSKEFVTWVLLANIVAWPIAYLLMKGWLDNFVYRIDMAFWMFLLAGVAAQIIALLTVSYQAVKAAMVNPVDALRYE